MKQKAKKEKKPVISEDKKDSFMRELLLFFALFYSILFIAFVIPYLFIRELIIFHFIIIYLFCVLAYFSYFIIDKWGFIKDEFQA